MHFLTKSCSKCGQEKELSADNFEGVAADVEAVLFGPDLKRAEGHGS